LFDVGKIWNGKIIEWHEILDTHFSEGTFYIEA
jgi:hypothetical protein